MAGDVCVDLEEASQQLLTFLIAKGLLCGRQEIRGHVWVECNGERFHLQIRLEKPENVGSGSGTVPMHVLQSALGPHDPPILFVHYPSWNVATAEKLLAARRWCCCIDHRDDFDAKRPLPNLCFEIPKKSPKQGQPYFGHPISAFGVRVDKYVQEDRKERM